MPTVPTPHTPLPPAPSIATPATFNVLADAFVGAQEPFGDQMDALAQVTYDNAVEANADAIATAADRVQTGLDRTAAGASATAAAGSASAAAGSASTSAGWSATSTTSMTPSAAQKTITVQTGKQFTAGTNIKVFRTSAPLTTYAFAAVDSYNTGNGQLVFTIGADDFATPGGPYTDWTVQLSGGKGATGPAGTVPSGSIIMWSGSIASIPAGWVICDGTNSTPDLRNRFIVGAGSTYAVNATGGATSNTPTITVGATTLSTAEMPAHTHQIYINGGGATGPARSTYDDGTGSTVPILSEGGGGSHTHSGTSAAVPTLPPYLALAYIMKT